jgi:ABC-type polysaccharide/polyol phosphate transport system ATPase subunit
MRSDPTGLPAIEVRDLSKVYRIYAKPLDMVVELLTGRCRHREHWALQQVSFSVAKGEAVGIIGRNGAGKSTMLRIMANTLDSSSGVITLRGRLAAILELGAGFHPEYTGRQNIYLGGICVGMTRAEIDAQLDSIIEFSELGHVIDQPFRTYSSGMKARLTFSVAISVRPDIFIIDEALAVGDIAFVEKCLLRIRQIIDSGCTVLLVSHNGNLINRFCSRAIWIENGRIQADGPSETVTKRYEIAALKGGLETASSELERVGDGKIRITGATLIGTELEPGIFMHGGALKVCLTLNSELNSGTANVIVAIHRSDGVCIWTGTSQSHLDGRYQMQREDWCIQEGMSEVEIDLSPLLFNTGSYHLSVGIEPKADVPTIREYHDYLPRHLKFAVTRSDRLVLSKAVDTPSTWTLRHVAPPSVDVQPTIREGCKVTVDRWPQGYQAALAISSDVEFTSWKAFLDLQRLFQGRGGLGLEIGFSMFFRTTHALCHGTFAFWKDQTFEPSSEAERLIELVRGGFIDTLHAYGDFDAGGFDRSCAERVGEICDRHGIRFPVWTNHGSRFNLQNLGHVGLQNYQQGDVPGSPSYHLDLLRRMGMRFAWVDDGLSPSIDAGDGLLYSSQARDGSRLQLFRRFRGLPGREAPNARNLGEQVSENDIDKLVQRGGGGVIYQHLGCGGKLPDGRFLENQAPYFDEVGMGRLHHISRLCSEGKLWVPRVSRLLAFAAARDALGIELEGGRLIARLPVGFEESDLAGLVLWTSTPFRGEVQLVIGAAPAIAVAVRIQDHGPGARIEFPSSGSRIFPW